MNAKYYFYLSLIDDYEAMLYALSMYTAFLLPAG